MTQATAIYNIWSMAAESLRARGTDDMMNHLDHVSKANLISVQTQGQLLEALEEVSPKWTSL